jgi:hypothetical protein
LSPLLWCLVVDELIARLNGGGVYIQGYADDFCLLVVGKFPNTVSGLIQWALHSVEMWCDKLVLLVNPDKTGLVAFMRRRKLPGFFEPRFFGTTLQGEARATTQRLWSLVSWSYLHPNRGHSSTLMRLQQSDPIFNTGVGVMRLAYNFEPKYRVTMLTTEDWTKGTGAPPVVKGLVWFTDGSKMQGGTRAGVYG